jgi:ankyrin repeat protein
MCEFLLANGADITLEDNKGWNALDISIIRMNYDTALYLKRMGVKPRPREFYENNLW